MTIDRSQTVFQLDEDLSVNGANLATAISVMVGSNAPPPHRSSNGVFSPGHICFQFQVVEQLIAGGK